MLRMNRRSAVLKKEDHGMKFKKFRHWAIALAAVLFIGSALVSSSALGKKTMEEADIFGCYEFGENIYTNPVSSFFPYKGDMPYYEISEKSLKIINNRDGTVQEFAGDFERKSLNKDNFESLFMMDFRIPDITQYKERYQYATYTSENVQGFRLYVMDREVWIADFHGKYLWSIYRLTKTDAVKPDGMGGFVVPEFIFKTTAGFQLEICRNKEVIDPVFIRDEKAMDILRNIILDYDLKSADGKNVDINTVGEYFRFYDTSEMNSAIYFAFYNEGLDPEPQIQSVRTPYGRASLSKEQYESLYELWEGGMALPASVTVRSGNHSEAALFYHGNEKTDLADLKNRLPYLEIQSTEDNCPFRVYADGEQMYGNYEIYDKETLDKLEFFHPSGLEPQTYILHNTVPGRKYIIELTTGYGYGDKTYGMKILFGVTLPQWVGSSRS